MCPIEVLGVEVWGRGGGEGWCAGTLMLQGTFRAHFCRIASRGSMFVLGHLKQRNGLGTKGSIFTRKCPMRICFSKLELQKVKK